MVKHLLTKYPNLFELSVSCTTRPPRGQEEHGKEYEGLYYGTLKEEIDRIEAAGRQVLFDVDVKGGLNLKRILGDQATSIFICPPSIEELRKRLEGRGDTSPEMIEKRLAKAEEELSYKPQFDRVLINDDLPHAFQQLDAIIENK